MKNYTESEVLDVLRKQVEKGTYREAAASIGVVPQYLNDVLSGRRLLSAKLALRLGFVKLPTTYVRKEN